VFHISGSKFIAARQIIFNGNCCVRVAKNLRHPLSHWELLLSAPSTFHNGLTSVTACLYFGEDQGAKDVAGENYIKAGIYSRQQQHNVATCNTPTHPHSPTPPHTHQHILRTKTPIPARRVSVWEYVSNACHVAALRDAANKKQGDASFRLATSCRFLSSQQHATC